MSGGGHSTPPTGADLRPCAFRLRRATRVRPCRRPVRGVPCMSMCVGVRVWSAVWALGDRDCRVESPGDSGYVHDAKCRAGGLISLHASDACAPPRTHEDTYTNSSVRHARPSAGAGWGLRLAVASAGQPLPRAPLPRRRGSPPRTRRLLATLTRLCSIPRARVRSAAARLCHRPCCRARAAAVLREHTQSHARYLPSSSCSSGPTRSCPRRGSSRGRPPLTPSASPPCAS